VQTQNWDGQWVTQPIQNLGRGLNPEPPLTREDAERVCAEITSEGRARGARLVSREVSDWYSIEADTIGVYELDLPVRVQNALHRKGYRTLGEIREGFDNGLIGIIRNIGAKGVAAVEAVLLEDGIDQ
jgi:DNA-directed RNA polymerase alpha subunit